MLFLQLLSIASAIAGIYGFYVGMPWLLIAGAVVSFLTYLDGFCSSLVENKLVGIMGATVGMFLIHFIFRQKWGISYALAMCAVCLIVAVIGLVIMIKDAKRR